MYSLHLFNSWHEEFSKRGASCLKLSFQLRNNTFLCTKSWNLSKVCITTILQRQIYTLTHTGDLLRIWQAWYNFCFLIEWMIHGCSNKNPYTQNIYISIYSFPSVKRKSNLKSRRNRTVSKNILPTYEKFIKYSLRWCI